MRIGYARVSTIDQDTSLQLSALRSACCDKIVEEKRSAVKHRPNLEDLLRNLKRGDVVIVYKLDRLARSLQHLLQILEHLNKVGATFKSLTEPISADTPAGRMMIQVLGSVAEFERAIIRERSMAGQLEAMKAGKLIGGRSKLSLTEKNEIIKLAGTGIPTIEIARAYGISRTRVLQMWREIQGRYVRKTGPLRALYERYKDHNRGEGL